MYVCVCGFVYHCVWRIALFCYELASASGLCRRIAFIRLRMTGGGQFTCMPHHLLVGCALANLLTLYMFVVVVIVDVTAVVLGGKVVD